MGSTYQAIATTTLTSTATSYSFSSIPSTYTDLVIIVSGLISVNTAGITLQVGNGSIDTNANYSYTDLYGNGSVAGSTRGTGKTNATDYVATYQLGWSNTDTNSLIINLMNYSNTTTYKTMISKMASTRGVEAGVNLWRSTSAINIVTIAGDSANFSTGSTFTLYGIKAA